MVVLLENVWHFMDDKEVMSAASEAIRGLKEELSTIENCEFLVLNMGQMLEAPNK